MNFDGVFNSKYSPQRISSVLNRNLHFNMAALNILREMPCCSLSDLQEETVTACSVWGLELLTYSHATCYILKSS